MRLESVIHKIFGTPLFWAVLVFTAIITFGPIKIKPFQLEEVYSEYYNAGGIYFRDFNNDGFDEEIRFDNKSPVDNFKIYDSQHNFYMQMNIPMAFTQNNVVFFYDTNHDSIPEIFFFTQYKDSLFLNISDPTKDYKALLLRFFVDTISPNLQGEYDLDGTGLKLLTT
jgi:hypothetical protein